MKFERCVTNSAGLNVGQPPPAVFGRSPKAFPPDDGTQPGAAVPQFSNPDEPRRFAQLIFERLGFRRLIVAALLLTSCTVGCAHAPQTVAVTAPLAPATPSSQQPATSTSSRPTSAPTTSAATQPAGPAGVVLREGAYIIDRIGRLIHTSDGQAELNFESPSATPGDSPMLVQPNLYLQQMEDLVARRGRDLRFKVSGMITEYKSHDYLLLQDVAVLEPLPVSRPTSSTSGQSRGP